MTYITNTETGHVAGTIEMTTRSCSHIRDAYGNLYEVSKGDTAWLMAKANVRPGDIKAVGSLLDAAERD